MSHPSSDELLIARLFDLPAADRAGFWQRACADEPALRLRHPEFARLFSAVYPELACGELAESVERGETAPVSPDSAATALTNDALADVLTSALGATDHEAPGTRIGHYKLLQKIGEGGFGSVWMAEQLEPIRRRVALKIVKIGMDTEEVIARFEAERQALALMDHPNIARVFDAGATAAGRPFFVMELVRGVAITHYCDSNRLPAEARLRLFIATCQAVQHAHQKGVIHRDLKPSNILVTLHDGKPVPKVIDFGIAKATDKQLTDKTLVTHFHAFVGTPAYTSPEQMEMSGLDVDTRSDIYSLGVLLYELLAGRPPFDPDALMKSGLEAMRRTIRETDPPRPSHRLGTLTDADRTSVAHARGTDPAKLSVLLRGDVDWIVMHCLEKDRTRRYETANALARDVERHLANEPVTARPPSSLYRLQKLFRRHKLAVGAAAAVTVSLIAGLIVSSALLVREHAAHSRAVAAETSESQLRQQAETARAAEAVRAGRTSLALAEQLLQENRTSEGLAHLVRAARSDPANTGVGPRLIAALAFRSFAEPLGETLRQSTPPWTIFYGKDGRHVLSYYPAEDVLRYWDLESGKLLQTINAGALASYDGGAPSPDGRLFATCGTDGSVNLWELATGRRVLGPLRHDLKVNAAQFSPDGRHLATGSDDHTARIWNVATGALETVLRHDYVVRTVAFSTDGTRLLTTTYQGPSRVWRLPDGTPVTPNIEVARERLNGGGNTTGGAFSPDDTLVVIHDQRGAQLFDASTGAIVGERMTHLGPVYRHVFTHDGKKLVTGSDDGTAQLWEIPTGKPLLPALPHGGRVNQVRLTPDERYLLTASVDGAARVWDLTTGQLALEPIRVGDVSMCDLAPDGSEFMTGGRDGALRRWRLAPGAAMPRQLSPGPDRRRVQRDAGNSTAAWAISRDRLQRIDLLTGAASGPPRIFPTPIGPTAELAFDGRHLAVMTAAGNLEMWDLQGTEIVRQPLNEKARGVSEFSPDSSYWAHLDGSNTLRVWRVDTGALAVGPVENVAKGMSFTRDGRRFAFSLGDNTAVIWDLATGRRIGEPLRHRAPLSGVQFSPDGRLVATSSSDGTARIWEAETGRPVGAPMLHRTLVRGVRFSRDGRRLLTWTPLDARVWDGATGAPLSEPIVGGNDISTAMFSDDGTRIATWSRTDHKVRLWGATTGQLLAEPVRVSANFQSSSQSGFVSSDRYLTMATARGDLSVWPVPPQSLHNPVPDWLLRLATAVAGGEIDARAVFREQAFDAKAFDEIRRELAALPATGLYVEWGRWFLADRTSRPIAPGFTITAAEAAKLGRDETPAVDEP